MASKTFKIGFVLDDGLDKPDGVQQYILTIGEWLRAQGHQVKYLVGETSRTDIPSVISMCKNVSVRFNGNRMTVPLPTAKQRITKVLKEHSFDILHIQVPYSPFMSQRLITQVSSRTAIIGTFHIAPNSKLVKIATILLGVWLRPSLKKFDMMLSVSPAAQTFAKVSFKTPSTILPNVINYERFHGAKPFAKYRDDRLTILFLGRLVPRKGCMELLKAVALLVEDTALPPFRVVICGKGPDKTKLEQYIAMHQLDEWVEMVGFVSESDKPRFYASADISIFPSTGGESFGIVLLEAMASGKSAVLAGNNSGYASVMSPQPELLFDPMDSTALANSIRSFLTDSKRRSFISDWGAHYSRQFDVTIVGSTLVKYYEEILHKR